MTRALVGMPPHAVALGAGFIGLAVLFGAVLVLGLGLRKAVALLLARPSAGLAGPGVAGKEDRSGAGERRAAAIGGLGEALVRAELAKLGWPVLSNVVLARRGWSVETIWCGRRRDRRYRDEDAFRRRAG